MRTNGKEVQATDFGDDTSTDVKNSPENQSRNSKETRSGKDHDKRNDGPDGLSVGTFHSADEPPWRDMARRVLWKALPSTCPHHRPHVV